MRNNWMRKAIPKGKKGNIIDVVYLPILLFATAISLFFIYFIWTSIKAPLSDNLTPDNPAAGTILTNVTGGLGVFDTMFPIFLAGVILTMLISAYMIDSYPFLFFISLFVFIVAILIATILANVHGEMIRTNPAFSSVIDDWSTTNWIINHLPIIVCATGFAVAIALYTKVPKGATI